MTKGSGVNLREILMDMLVQTLEEGEYSHLVLKNVLDKYQYLEKQERAFLSRVFEGTIEYLLQLDAILDSYSKVKVKKMKPFIRTLLRMSVYQILYMDTVPDSAVCNEAVKLAKKRGFAGLSGFVNGILRKVSREKEQISFSSLSEEYSMPEWIIEEWKKQYSDDVIEATLQEFLKRSPLHIRCNTSRISVKELLKVLQKENISCRQHPYLEYAFEIRSLNTLYDLKSFHDGLFQVQDISSMLVAHAAGIKEGDRILDICAAPGGKALHAADLLNGTGSVEARDLTEYKVGLIQENIERSQLNNITAVCFDGLVPDKRAVERYDIVIADLPCSGLGVIGRKPDIKYQMTPDKIKALQELQRNLLNQASQYVKPGGILMYSTCTISLAENQDNVKWFLENYPFESVSLEEAVSKEILCDTKADGYMQLLPGIHHTDGFFIAKFRRKM